MACNHFKNAWGNILLDRLSKNDYEEISTLIEVKMKDRKKPKCTQTILNKLANKLEKELKTFLKKEEN